MTRNHFSKHGGPYFINDGLSNHDHSHTSHTNEDIKPDKMVFYFITIGFVSLLLLIGITLTTLS